MYHGYAIDAMMLRNERSSLSEAAQQLLTKSSPWLILLMKTYPLWNLSGPDTIRTGTTLAYWSLRTHEAEGTGTIISSLGFLRQNHTLFFSSFLLFHPCPRNHLCPLIEPHARFFFERALPIVKVAGKSTPRVHSA